MVDAVHWTIGAVWAAAGIVGYSTARRRNGLAGGMLLALGLLAAAAATLRWHVAFHQLARDWLHDADVYQQRVWFKAVIAFAVVTVVVLVWRLLRRGLHQLPSGLRVALLTMLLWAGYLAAYTAFLDDLLPAAFAQWPLRQLLEAAFAVTAFGGVLTGRRAHAGPR